MAANFLRNFALLNFLYKRARIKQRSRCFITAWVEFKPILAPGMLWRNDVFVSRAVVQHQMPDNAPCCGKFEFFKEMEQPLNHNFAFDLARFFEFFYAV